MKAILINVGSCSRAAHKVTDETSCGGETVSGKSQRAVLKTVRTSTVTLQQLATYLSARPLPSVSSQWDCYFFARCQSSSNINVIVVRMVVYLLHPQLTALLADRVAQSFPVTMSMT